MLEQNSPPIGYRINVAAKKLGLSRSSIYRMAKRGDLEIINLTERTALVTKRSLDRLVSEVSAQK